jgi:AraC family transcriptional regulator
MSTRPEPTPLKRIQPVLAFAAQHRDEDLSLAALATRSGLSPFHLHRLFSAAASETPKQFTLRLRLERAALLLLQGERSVLNVALSCGFRSHEAFCRAFRRCFGMRPGAYRSRGLDARAEKSYAGIHATLVTSVGPCIRLYHTSTFYKQGSHINEAMEYTITKKQIAPQAVLVARRRIKPSEIPATLAEVLGGVFQYAQRTGAALAGQPFTRYLESGPGLITIEAGMPIAAPGSGDGNILADTLPGGFVATTIHSGPYDGLTAAHAAIQVWIEQQGLAAAGAPWESYVTDPADYPDPADWKTEIFWPLV